MASELDAAAAARRLMPSLAISSSGMTVQQGFLDVIARNIANSETTQLPGGGPYQRQVASAAVNGADGQVTTQVRTDTTPGRMVYDPAHPDANEQGFVEYPNVDVETEMVDLMVARRMYEANATVFSIAKRMLRRALEI